MSSKSILKTKIMLENRKDAGKQISDHLAGISNRAFRETAILRVFSFVRKTETPQTSSTSRKFTVVRNTTPTYSDTHLDLPHPPNKSILGGRCTPERHKENGNILTSSLGSGGCTVEHQPAIEGTVFQSHLPPF